MDTRDKRASVLGLGLAALLLLPEPGTIDQPDRQQLAFCYRGIDTTVTPGQAITLTISGTAVTVIPLAGTTARSI